jgi:hypothetical protein
MQLDVPNAKRVYNWFHFAFPNFEQNELCTPEDISLRNKIERWLIAQGE